MQAAGWADLWWGEGIWSHRLPMGVCSCIGCGSELKCAWGSMCTRDSVYRWCVSMHKRGVCAEKVCTKAMHRGCLSMHSRCVCVHRESIQGMFECAQNMCAKGEWA